MRRQPCPDGARGLGDGRAGRRCGRGSTTLSPGDTRQLFATATLSDGTTIDVTNLATWQTSSANIVSVSPSGLVTAAAEGAVTSAPPIRARAARFTRTSSRRARSRLLRRRRPTPHSAAPARSGYGQCRLVRLDVAQRRRVAAAGGERHRHGTFTYTLPANSTPDARRATLIVETTGGASATHTVTEDKPLGCSYVTQPEELTFSAAGGIGQFTVVTTPNDCRWTLINGLSQLGVSVLSGFSGTGNGACATRCRPTRERWMPTATSRSRALGPEPERPPPRHSAEALAADRASATSGRAIRPAAGSTPAESSRRSARRAHLRQRRVLSAGLFAAAGPAWRAARRSDRCAARSVRRRT